jgi:hypothetical protein
MDHALAERQFIRGAPSARNKTKQHHTSPSQNIPHVSSGEDLKQRTNGILKIQLAASTSSEQTRRGQLKPPSNKLGEDNIPKQLHFTCKLA